MVRYPLRDYPLLPVGRRDGGEVHRSIAFKRWMAEDDLEIGRMLEKAGPTTGIPAFVTDVLGHFLTDWQDREPQAMKPGERSLMLRHATAADVLTAWIQLRRQALGDEMSVQLTCEACRHEFTFVAALGTLDLDVVEDGETMEREVVLRDGLAWRGKTLSRLLLGPIAWGAYDLSPKDRGNLSALKLAIVRASLRAADGVDAFVPSSEELLKGLTKYDFELLTTTVTELKIGPNLELDMECPGCGGRINRSIPWEYGRFFSIPASSLSGG